ncbi:hypothetical protein CPB83DRAFT_897795 [Crepidotus variabilis]|uniref:Uncharacterized protein n=1 Tax=Crepidotus variabilis TaxID=179855 RepID=A0A9P6E8V4_9AGAR|nr:hypothetical protein CPB83DRAFT_897795 [Crepidotus variabilis]
MLAFSSLSVTAAIFIAGAHASPTFYPDVTLAPGLPSFESLGLTTKDLYTKPPVSSSSSSLEARSSNAQCVSAPEANGSVDGAIACYNILARMGDASCPVPDNNRIFCSVNDIVVIGTNTNHISGGTSSSCGDVALAVQYIFNHCNVGGRVSGVAVANGNGNLMVGVYNKNYPSLPVS